MKLPIVLLEVINNIHDAIYAKSMKLSILFEINLCWWANLIKSVQVFVMYEFENTGYLMSFSHFKIRSNQCTATYEKYPD